MLNQEEALLLKHESSNLVFLGVTDQLVSSSHFQSAKSMTSGAFLMLGVCDQGDSSLDVDR